LCSDSKTIYFETGLNQVLPRLLPDTSECNPQHKDWLSAKQTYEHLQNKGH